MNLDQARRNRRWLAYGIVACLVLFAVAVYFQGKAAMLAALIYLLGMLLALLWRDRPLAALRGKKALIALAAVATVVVLIHYDAGRVEPQISQVAAALKQYQQRHGHYPARLQELVPEFLTEVPRLRWAAMASDIRYTPDPQDPGLMWTVMAPYGRNTLRVDSGKRGQLD